MKVLVSVLIAAVLSIVFVGAVFAEQPVQYALVKCSGLDIDQVVSGQQSFDTAYGFAKQLTTKAQWDGSYVARTNEFAHLVGCPNVLKEDGAVALTYWANLYVPVFQSILTNKPFPY